VRRHRSNSSLSLASLEVERRDTNECPLGMSRQEMVLEFRNVEEERVTNHSVIHSCSTSSVAEDEECCGVSAEFISTRTSLNPGKLGGSSNNAIKRASLVGKDGGGDNSGSSDVFQCNQRDQGRAGGDAEVPEGNKSHDRDDDNYEGKKIISPTAISSSSSYSSEDGVGDNAEVCMVEDLRDGDGKGEGIDDVHTQDKGFDSDGVKNHSEHSSSSSSSGDERDIGQSCVENVLADDKAEDFSTVLDGDSLGIIQADDFSDVVDGDSVGIIQSYSKEGRGANIAEYCELGENEGDDLSTSAIKEIEICKGETIAEEGKSSECFHILEDEKEGNICDNPQDE